MAVQPTYEELLLIIEKQQAMIESLQKRVALLEQELARYQRPKNSKNSRLAPSKDENRALKNQSLGC